jgi:hypothetical protein
MHPSRCQPGRAAAWMASNRSADDAKVGEEDRAVRTAQIIPVLMSRCTIPREWTWASALANRPAGAGGLGWRKSRAASALRQRHTVDELHHQKRDSGIDSGAEQGQATPSATASASVA